jgi:hypothetical protein
VTVDRDDEYSLVEVRLSGPNIVALLITAASIIEQTNSYSRVTNVLATRVYQAVEKVINKVEPDAPEGRRRRLKIVLDDQACATEDVSDLQVSADASRSHASDGPGAGVLQ